MSRNPGIGMMAIKALVEAFNTSAGALYIARHGDVPIAFQVGSKVMPLGRTIREHLRLALFGDHRQPQRAKDLREQQFFVDHLPFVPPDASPVVRQIIASEFHEEATSAHRKYVSELGQKALNLEAREAIRSSMKTL